MLIGVAAVEPGYRRVVFGDGKNPVNQQINLYLTGRILVGLATVTLCCIDGPCVFIMFGDRLWTLACAMPVSFVGMTSRYGTC